MSLNETVSAERVHIGFFGLRNAGKSSLVNALTGQEISVVSNVKGTTTDPVKKAMELLPLGPVMIIDTPGLDDEGELGTMRVQRAKRVLAGCDIAVLVCDASTGIGPLERELIGLFEEKKLPYVIAHNKSDLLKEKRAPFGNEIYVSAITSDNIDGLKRMLGALAGSVSAKRHLVGDLLSPGDLVVLVIPIDEAAPKGRLILPQQQTIRDILESNCTVVACRESELKGTFSMLSQKPKLVITDSQAFGRVSKDTPEDIMLTSFSILFARYKGELNKLVGGAAALSTLRDGDKVLISEGCTHHRQCKDIGSVKMPAWIEGFTGVKPQYLFTSGGDFPDDLSKYKLIVHCGGCMLTEKEMKNRIEKAGGADVPIVNYGIAIAHMHGILKRSLEPFPDALELI